MEIQEDRAALIKAVKHLTMSVVSAAFFGWVERVQENQELRARLEKAVRFMANRAISGAWSTWKAG